MKEPTEKEDRAGREASPEGDPAVQGPGTVRPLTRDEVRAAIGFGYPPRPPRVRVLWHDRESIQRHGEPFGRLLREFPDDVLSSGMVVDYWQAPRDDPTYRFAFADKVRPEGVAVDSCPIITDWSELDAFLEEFPDARRPSATDSVRAARQSDPDRYVLVGWGHYFHQRLVNFRGLQTLMLDFHDAADRLRVIMDRLLELYRVWAGRAAEAGADGVWAGDDLGTQRSLLMSPEFFRRFYAPYYAALADVLHTSGLDFWFHSCGNLTEILDDLMGCGVDVLHPIQWGTMDDAWVAGRCRGRMACWVGMDVQHVLPSGTTDEVRRHVRCRIRAFNRPEGGLVVGAGNVIPAETPLENLRAYCETLFEPL